MAFFIFFSHIWLLIYIKPWYNISMLKIIEKEWRWLMDTLRLYIRIISAWLEAKKEQIRSKFIEMVLKHDHKHGYSMRCKYCTDNMFCESYCSKTDKSFFHPWRCGDFVSTRWLWSMNKKEEGANDKAPPLFIFYVLKLIFI